MAVFPAGKLPQDVLHALISRIPIQDDTVLQGPGVGLDCAVLDLGDKLLVAKSDPITFATAEIGWYAVHVNANDIATTGARPQWFLATLLLPENVTGKKLVQNIFDQIQSACADLGVTLVGGHTEITTGIDRPIVAGTMLGTTTREELISPDGTRPGDRILLSKSIPIEATAILANEFGSQLTELSSVELQTARDYIHTPGISVVKEALAAATIPGVHAMHDPTEGGLAGALWEMAEAAGTGMRITAEHIPISALSAKVCRSMNIPPLEAIASGALLIAAAPAASPQIMETLAALGIPAVEIGHATDTPGIDLLEESGTRLMRKPARDALASLFE